MKSTNVSDQTTTAAAVPYTTDFVTSKDGTAISYRQLGHGPGVVMLHGAMESAQSHMQLSRALADAYTVYLPERRGHTLGIPFVKDYGIRKEVEDLEALLTKTGSHYIFGVSAGGLICLEAALRSLTVHKAALYEPAFIVNGLASTAFLPRYDREIAQGKIAAALITGMQGAQFGPPIFKIMPRWLLESLTSLSIKSEDRQAKPGDITMRMLAPTLHYDFQLVAQLAEKPERFIAVPTQVLLLGGSNSPAWLKAALDALEKVLPHVERVEFPGLDHGGSSDPSATNRAGKPELVAQELRRFFAEPWNI